MHRDDEPAAHSHFGHAFHCNMPIRIDYVSVLGSGQRHQTNCDRPFGTPADNGGHSKFCNGSTLHLGLPPGRVAHTQKGYRRGWGFTGEVDASPRPRVQVNADGAAFYLRGKSSPDRRASIRDIVAANASGNIVCRVQGPVSPLARLHRLRNLDERVATISAFENHHPPVRAILPRPLEPCPMSD
jgi:hypothetical protein